MDADAAIGLVFLAICGDGGDVAKGRFEGNFVDPVLNLLTDRKIATATDNGPFFPIAELKIEDSRSKICGSPRLD